MPSSLRCSIPSSSFAVRPLALLGVFACALAAGLRTDAQTATVAANWTQQSPAASPPARRLSVMAYDAATAQVVLFGGYSGSGSSLNDTWTWNGTTWTQQSPATSPSARYESAMAYDAATGQVVLFGGAGNGVPNDTWTWNGSTWTQQSPVTSPPARSGAVMAYDAATGQVVLFGGSGISGALLNDTWTWNGTNWTQQNPAASPSARQYATMAYDGATAQVVLFGGFYSITTSLNDTWTWNGTTWTQQSPATSPSVRYLATTAYNPVTQQVVLFGGSNGSSLGDTWTWNGTTWNQQSPATSPSARFEATTAYDTAAGQLVLFGGFTSSGFATFADTWSYQIGAAASPASAVGTAAAQTPVYFTIGTAGTLPTLSNSNVLTQGAPNLDFTLGTGSTCTGAVTANQTCTVNVAFTPQTPGPRLGAVNLTNSSGTVLATAYISGTGAGPLATLTPGTFSTVAGTGTAGYVASQDGGPATSAELNLPFGVALDGAGNLYISEYTNNRVRKVTASTGVITTVAGNGSICSPTTGTCGDGGIATSANVTTPYAVTVDGAGNLFIADTNGERIRKVTAATGVISTVAGNGTPCSATTAVCGDGGAATSANIYLPEGVLVDSVGNLYFSDSLDHRIRFVSAATGIITTIAGTGTPCASTTSTCGDGGAATAANLNNPVALALDGAGNLYFADAHDNRIRKVTAATGVISTIAGSGTQCSPSTAACGDGGLATASGADLNDPTGLALDAAGNLYIAEYHNNRVRMVTAATGLLSTIAGTGNTCSPTTAACGDGGAATATGANFYGPFTVALDGSGNLFVSDVQNQRIREITGLAATLSFPTATVGNSSTLPLTVNNIGNAALTFPIPSGSGSQNPSVSNYFTISNSSTCPLVYSSSSSAGMLAAGANCSEILTFTPAFSGSVSGKLVFTDNSLNAANATQVVHLTGSTTAGLTVTAVSQTIPYGTPSITLEFTVGYGGTTAPTGTPTLTVSGSATGVGTIACTVKAGHNNCTASYNTSTLARGQYTVMATQPADTNYAQGSGTASLTVY